MVIAVIDHERKPHTPQVNFSFLCYQLQHDGFIIQLEEDSDGENTIESTEEREMTEVGWGSE